MPAPVQIARRESAFSPDPSRSPLLHPALSTSLSRSFGLNSPFSLSAMSTSLKDLSSSPGFSSMAMSLGRSFEERPKIEAQFFKNFTCCGLDLHDLHGLLEHFEECHVAFDDDGAGSDGGMDLEGVEPAESEGTISGPPSPRLLAHGVRELKKSGLSSFETPDSPATQALHLDGGMELDMEMGDEVAGEDGSSPSSVGSASSHLTSSSGFPQQPAMSSFENPLPLHGSASKKKQQQQAAAAAAAAAAGQQQPPPPAQPSFAASTGISPASTTIPSLPGVPAVNISGLSSSRPGTPSAVEPPNPIDSTAFLPPMPPSGTVNPAAALGAPPVAPPVGGGFAPLLLFPGGGGAAGQPVASTSSHVHSSSQSPPPPVGMGLGAGLGLGGAGMGMGGDFGVEPEEEEETEEDESDEDDTDDEEEDEQQQRQQAQFLLNQYQAQAPQHGLGTLPFLPPGSLPPVPPPTAPGQRPKHHPNHVPLHQQQQQQKKAAAAAAASSQHSPSPHPIIINPHDPHTIAALANTTLKDPMQTAAAIAALGPNSLAALPTALHPLGQGVQISPSGRPYTPPSEKPFKCTVPGCDKSYKQQNGLKYHRLHGHCGANAVKDGVDPRSEGKPYVCHVASCGKRYKNMNGLRYHYQHSGAHGALGLQMLAQGCHPPPQFPPGHKRTGGSGGGSHQLAQSYIPGGSASSSRASSPHGGYGAVRGMGGAVDAHGLMSAAGRYA